MKYYQRETIGIRLKTEPGKIFRRKIYLNIVYSNK